MMPDHDCPYTWSIARTKGLTSDQTAFLFKLLHQLLPTRERISRITNEQGLCRMCGHASEDLLHALFTCTESKATADQLLSYVHVTVPRLSPPGLLRLDLGSELDETDLLATLCIISTGLKYIWQARADKKRILQYKMRAELESIISILRKTRFSKSADRMLEMII